MKSGNGEETVRAEGQTKESQRHTPRHTPTAQSVIREAKGRSEAWWAPGHFRSFWRKWWNCWKASENVPKCPFHTLVPQESASFLTSFLSTSLVLATMSVLTPL